MKRIVFILLIAIAFVACEKEPVPPTGDLLIILENPDGFTQSDVDVWLYDSKYGFDNFEFYDLQISDENGEVFWSELPLGWYYIEAEITIPVNYVLSAIDSIEVTENTQRNKRLILSTGN